MNSIVHRIISGKTVLFTLVPLISINCFGQGEFLDLGTHGFGFDGTFTLALPSDEDNASLGNTGIGGGLGVSLGGFIDLQFGLGRFNYNNDLQTQVISPGLTIHPTKQNETLPISMRLTLSWGQYKYSGAELKKNNLIMDGTSVNLGLGLYRKLSLSGDQSIFLSVDAVYSISTITVTENRGRTTDTDDEFLTVLFSVPLTINLSENQILYFMPSIAFGNKSTVIGVTLGFVLPFNKGAGSNENTNLD